MKPFDVLTEVRRRSAEAVIAQSGLSHEGLRRHLRLLLGGDDPSAGGLLQEPVLEGAHPFVTADETMGGLSGRLLHQDLVTALDGLPEGHDYRFPRARRPFQHQVDTWQALADPVPRSTLVTSGTGSGKTECFLFPILSALVAQVQERNSAIEGVQAIMLYPLNALIESQRERLTAWASPFGGRVRYCLYNGDLPPAAKESERRRVPEQVIDREQLRSSPPPLLVTNITMLEYMLARVEDQLIIDRSKGKLKWIVLDEAHSLVGAAAAEVALLLRRVLLAFGVDPEEVRFIATSATIGSGEETRHQLQRFLANVAGVPDDRVVVIEGHRKMPGRPEKLPDQPLRNVLEAEPDLLYDVLGRDPKTWRLVERLFEGGVPLRDFAEPARTYGIGAADLVVAMSRASRKRGDGEEERLAPVRLHAFERAVAGMWSCINPDCANKPPDWQFGGILSDRADECPACGAPALEIVSCRECGEVYLEGAEKGPELAAPQRNPPRDEFAFDSVRENDTGTEEEEDAGDEPDPGEDGVFEQDRLFAACPTPVARRFWMDRRGGWRVVDAPVDGGLTLLCEDHAGANACPHCSPGGRAGPELIRPLRFGAPFLLGNAAPLLLEGVEPARSIPRGSLPSAGRRLLSFTDSRQGTARIAAKLQMESERNFVRSFVYHQVQASMQPAPGAEHDLTRIRSEISQYEKAVAATPLPALEGALIEKRRLLATLSSGSTDGIAWPELVDRLARRIEVAEWIGGVWRARDEELFADTTKIAEFLLLREFARRPRRANSVETLGLARLRNPSIDRLTQSDVPGPFRRRAQSIEAWQVYLDAVLTWFVRANGAIAILKQTQHWVSSKARLTSLVGPDSHTEDNDRLRAWPNGYFRAHPRSRPVALLTRGLGLDLDDKTDRSDLDECLHAAWMQVQATFSPDPERRVFDFSKSYLAPVVVASYCPVTRRVLDRAPFGLSPYGVEEKADARRRALPITMPRHPIPNLGHEVEGEGREAIRAWIERDAEIAKLRAKGAWTDISDRIAQFADYARSAEHSAQQTGARLRRYEREFKAGRINILNCSTTMEMGVDIGSVSSVMMTNVPPSIANYRQRVGRAGRRGQSVALAFTFCKDRPLDREAFRDPQAFLRRTIAAPNVTLSSRPIVQRHVNAYLLGKFMRERAGDALKMQIGAFFGCPTDPAQARPSGSEQPVEEFMAWLDRPVTAVSCKEDLETLTRRSILEGDQRLIEDSKSLIAGLAADFVTEWNGLVSLAKDEGLREGGKSRMAVELKRMCGEFLLGSLADRGFLPGHGFPTDVVSFLPGKEFKSREDIPQDGARQFRSVGPQRSLDLAIRDYAPGSEVVLDGLVHKSAGVTLNWKRPANEENLAEIQSLRTHWRCLECGASDTARGRSPDSCTACGAVGPRKSEFLRPAGFSVDPRARAHADTDTLSYVPPEDPLVSTRDATWQNLPLPDRGRFRCSREGLVYYSNRGGPKGFGYAVCLQCGRAEADADNSGRESPQPALVDHRPLRYRKGVDACPGNEQPFGIKRNISLGLEVTTDVFELQLAHEISRAGANALVIALREALAQELGIDADEMGFGVSQSRTALGAVAASLFLFDRATGGAGFAVSFEQMIRPVIRRAERILECKTPGCETACAACVLTSDAPDGKGELDRTEALEFVRAHLSFPEGLGEGDRFVDGAELSLVVLDEIDRELRRASQSTLTIFVPVESRPTSMLDWPLASQIPHWTMRGYPVRLAVSAALLDGLSAAEKLVLRDFALQYNVQLVQGDAPAFQNGSLALATVASAAKASHAWVSREDASRIPGPAWARPNLYPVAQGKVMLAPKVSPVELSALLPPPGAQLVQITSELDGDLKSYGARVSNVIIQLLTKCRSWPEKGIAQVSYEDAYVSSPLVARLMIDTIKQLSLQSGAHDTAVTLKTRPPRVGDQRSQPWQIGHDWRDPGEQKAVIEGLGKLSGLRVSLRHEDVPHGRYLSIRFASGAEATIVLDQGFGAWAPPKHIPVRHDFRADAATQARRIASANVSLQRKGVGKTYLIGVTR